MMTEVQVGSVPDIQDYRLKLTVLRFSRCVVVIASESGIDSVRKRYHPVYV